MNKLLTILGGRCNNPVEGCLGQLSLGLLSLSYLPFLAVDILHFADSVDQVIRGTVQGDGLTTQYLNTWHALNAWSLLSVTFCYGIWNAVELPCLGSEVYTTIKV